MTPNTDIHAASPPTLDHVIGQRRAVRQLKTALDAHFNDAAASARGVTTALPHTLLVGPPGVGKSLLAGVIARELGANLHEELAQNVFYAEALQGLFVMADGGDCVFLDEIHELPQNLQTLLYRALEERRLFLPCGNNGKCESLTLPPLTFVGATTDEWALAKPLRDRFKIILRLEHYSTEELAQLIAQRARRLGWSVSDDAIRGIAERGRGTPRLALRLLEATRRTARAANEEVITLRHFEETCEIEGVDGVGLDPIEQRYLRILQESGGKARLNMIATALGLPRRTIETVIESDLVRLGLITKADDGRRTLTHSGIQHLTHQST